MRFASDNTGGVSTAIMAALAAAADGHAPAYGADDASLSLDGLFGELFETDVRVLPVVTGTAANALALAASAPPWGVVLAHEHAHALLDECGAPEFFSGGARVEGLAGPLGRIDPGVLATRLGRPDHGVHAAPASALTLTQATEAGTVYPVDQVAELAAIAHGHGLAVHMDGARFANALVALGCAPADATWRAGVDILSFGATKNGAMAVEAIVAFDAAAADGLERRRKRSGHLLSKMRYLSVQLRAYLADDHWLDNARAANASASRLAAGLGALGIELAAPCEANEVFAVLAADAIDRLRTAGASFYEERVGERPAVRLVTSFSTTDEEVDAFLAVLDGR